MLMALRAISMNSPAHQLALVLRKRKFLKGSPKNSMNFFILTDVTLKKIWTDFEEIHDLATDSIGGPSEVLSPKSLGWINLFCSLREKQLGYERSWVTLYMRIISYLLYKKPWQLQKVFWPRSGKKQWWCQESFFSKVKQMACCKRYSPNRKWAVGFTPSWKGKSTLHWKKSGKPGSVKRGKSREPH